MKAKYLANFIVLLCCGLGGWHTPKVCAQDAEFSQFYAAPLHINPAMIGFTSAPRFTLNYRQQHPAFSNAYLTLAASYDQHFDKLNSSLGFSVLADRAGGGLYNTYHVSGLYAYQLFLTNKLLLKAGVQVGYINQGIDASKLLLGENIDPLTGNIIGTPTIPLEQNSIHRLDLGLGLLAYTDKFYIGASFKHITQPDLSFTNNEDTDNVLALRSMFQIGHVFYFGNERREGSRFYINPSLMFINQGDFFLLNGGILFGKGAIFAGSWVKHTMSNFDALTMMIGVRAGVFKIGYSYDFNLGPLNTNTGAHEVSLQFDFGQTRAYERQRRMAKTAQCPEGFR